MISNDESENEGDDSECLFLALEKKIVSANLGKCTRKNAPEKKRIRWKVLWSPNFMQYMMKNTR